jgi:putative ABC transport system ATP-binding protein
VLADEPTGNLDSASGASVLGLFEELNAQGATILVITHDHDLAARLPRQVQVLDGQIVADTGGGRLEAHTLDVPITPGAATDGAHER